jgi:hypothetical protein
MDKREAVSEIASRATMFNTLDTTTRFFGINHIMTLMTDIKGARSHFEA